MESKSYDQKRGLKDSGNRPVFDGESILSIS